MFWYFGGSPVNYSYMRSILLRHRLDWITNCRVMDDANCGALKLG